MPQDAKAVASAPVAERVSQPRRAHASVLQACARRGDGDRGSGTGQRFEPGIAAPHAQGRVSAGDISAGTWCRN